jgi:hypothetical protein
LACSAAIQPDQVDGGIQVSRRHTDFGCRGGQPARGLVNDVEITFACSDSLMLLFNGLARELGDALAL